MLSEFFTIHTLAFPKFSLTPIGIDFSPEQPERYTASVAVIWMEASLHRRRPQSVALPNCSFCQFAYDYVDISNDDVYRLNTVVPPTMLPEWWEGGKTMHKGGRKFDVSKTADWFFDFSRPHGLNSRRKLIGDHAPNVNESR